MKLFIKECDKENQELCLDSAKICEKVTEKIEGK